jgi:hypothetical protein
MATLPRDQLVKARCPVCSSARVGDLFFFTQRLDPPRDCQIIHTTFNPPPLVPETEDQEAESKVERILSAERRNVGSEFQRQLLIKWK